jgi:redox-sensitive bicupin YhaK (pirin superfamily)
MTLPFDPAALPPGDEPQQVVAAPTRDLGDGFRVRRALPTAHLRNVGPFVFFDQMGPVQFDAGHGLDVRPHPHIGLATVTYLFEGEILHRDSLGTVQSIRPGAVNWMTAGRGIVHSERTPKAVREQGGRVLGIQLWVALPREHEEDAPSFAHTPAEDLPLLADHGVKLRVVIGELFGARSPVKVLSQMFYAAAELEDGARLPLPAAHAERGVYVAEGALEVAGTAHPAGTLLSFRKESAVTLRASGPARVLLLGGESLDAPRHIWWNFVSSSRDRIEAAKADWRAGTMGAVPGETERIPLPDDPPPPVRYP